MLLAQKAILKISYRMLSDNHYQINKAKSEAVKHYSVDTDLGSKEYIMSGLHSLCGMNVLNWLHPEDRACDLLFLQCVVRTKHLL